MKIIIAGYWGWHHYEESFSIALERLGHTVIPFKTSIYFNGKLYNCAAFIENRKLQGFYAKQILANEGVHYETRWFNPWPSGGVFDIEIKGNNYPIGDNQFEYLNKKYTL